MYLHLQFCPSDIKCLTFFPVARLAFLPLRYVILSALLCRYVLLNEVVLRKKPFVLRLARILHLVIWNLRYF